MIRFMFRNFASAAGAACALSLLPACFFEHTPPTNYDLATPQSIELNYQIKVRAFSTAGIGHCKMTVRESLNRLKLDEYNRWSQQPGAMITKYLTAIFAQNDESIGVAKNVYYLSGSVMACELDKTENVAYLLIRYAIGCDGIDTVPELGTVSYRIKIQSATPEAFAEALTQAANRFALHVKKEIDASIVAENAKKKSGR